jgi:hypothetical protein
MGGSTDGCNDRLCTSPPCDGFCVYLHALGHVAGQFCYGWRTADEGWQWTVNATAVTLTGFVGLEPSSVVPRLLYDRLWQERLVESVT